MILHREAQVSMAVKTGWWGFAHHCNKFTGENLIALLAILADHKDILDNFGAREGKAV